MTNELKIEILDDQHHTGCVDIYIDGRSILDLIAEFEKAYDPAANYEEIESSRSNDDYFTTWDVNTEFDKTVFDTPLQPREKAVVLVCGCGMASCSSTQVDVHVTEDTVTWSNLRTWITKYEPYPNFGPWVFERSQYEAELEKLHARIAADKSHNAT